MSQNGAEAHKTNPPQPQRRHQITRSITELSSPLRMHRHQSHRAPTITTGAASPAIASMERESKRAPLAQASMPVAPLGRLSLDGYRSDAATPNLTPNTSRRTSIHLAPIEDSHVISDHTTGAPGTGMSAESSASNLEEEGDRRAAAREALVSPASLLRLLPPPN